MPIEWRDVRVATGGDHLSGIDCTEEWLASRTCTKIGCGPLFGSECFAQPCGPKPRNTKMVLRCLKDYFGSLLSRYQGHTSQVSWIAAGLRALRPCRNKPEQIGWHKSFFPQVALRHFLCHLVETFSLPLRGFMLESVQRTQDMVQSKMLITRRTRDGIFPQLSLEGESTCQKALKSCCRLQVILWL